MPMKRISPRVLVKLGTYLPTAPLSTTGVAPGLESIAVCAPDGIHTAATVEQGRIVYCRVDQGAVELRKYRPPIGLILPGNLA